MTSRRPDQSASSDSHENTEGYVPQRDDTQAIPVVPDYAESATQYYDPTTAQPTRYAQTHYAQPDAYGGYNEAGYDPGYPGYGQAPGYEPEPERSTARSVFVTVGILILLLALAAGLGWWVYTTFLQPTARPAPTTMAPQTVTTTTVVVETPTTTSSTPSSSAAPTTTQGAPSAFAVPQSAGYCSGLGLWNVYSGNPSTSCAFAENTAIAMDQLPRFEEQNVVKVVSPVTNTAYSVTCTLETGLSFSCVGGDGAVVYLQDH